MPGRTTDLHHRRRLARGAHQQAEYALATLLHEVYRTQRYTERGHASVIAYGEAEIDLTPRQTRDLVFVAKRLAALPALEEAFPTGRVGYTEAREGARVATPEPDASWTARAMETTNRTLERQVAEARRGTNRRPTRMRNPARVKVTVVMSAAEAEVLASAFARVRFQGGFGTDVENGARLAEMARRPLAAIEADEAASETPAQAPTAERFRVTVHRRAVPHGRNRRWLDLHHLRPRAAGGDHRTHNLVCPCSVHHQMIHRGELSPDVDDADVARGMAPRLRYVLSTGETLGERRPEAPPVAEVVDRLRAVALDTLHALGQTVTRPDDTWFGADRVVTGRAAGVSYTPLRPTGGDGLRSPAGPRKCSP